MKLNSEKARCNLIQDLRNKEMTQTRIQSLLNSFGNMEIKPMEIANLLIYRFSTLESSIACNKQTTFLLKLLRESVPRSNI